MFLQVGARTDISLTFVTLEIGTSWRGDFGILEQIIKMAKYSNVDAIKFQSLSKELIERHDELKYYKSASLDKSNIVQIADMCDVYDMEFYSTVTYPEAVDFLDEYVKRYKIRCVDCFNEQIGKELKATNKEIIVSSVRPLANINGKIKNLYCIPRYPVEFNEINFDILKKFDGYSNHCKESLALFKAVLEGIEYLEFHITPSASTFLIDNSVSFSLIQTSDIMRIIRLIEQ